MQNRLNYHHPQLNHAIWKYKHYSMYSCTRTVEREMAREKMRNGKNGQCSSSERTNERTNKSRREWTAVNLQYRKPNGQNKSCNKCWIGSKTAIGFVRLVPLAIMVVLISYLFAIDISLPLSSLSHAISPERFGVCVLFFFLFSPLLYYPWFDSLRISHSFRIFTSIHTNFRGSSKQEW